MKRFQECNWIIKTWRYRWYLTIPFYFIFYRYLKFIKIGIDEIKDGKIVDSGKSYKPSAYELWSLCIGMVQSKMKWYYTSEEVFGKYNKY